MSLFRLIRQMLGSDDSNQSNWNELTDPDELERLLERSHETPQLIYKHSTMCGTSMFAKSEILGVGDRLLEQAELNYIDVIGNRTVSNRVADELQVRHESPQVLLVHCGDLVWHTSHGGIRGTVILKELSNLQKAS